MRVYLPATLPGLRAALTAGEIGPAPLIAFAVTPALREWYVEGDAEELDYAALRAAARASLRLLDADPGAPRRRVVLAADVDDRAARPEPAADRGAVRLGAAVAIERVVSAHVDDPAAEAAVGAAAEAVIAADLGSEEAAFTVDEADGHELMWFAAQELGALVELV